MVRKKLHQTINVNDLVVNGGIFTKIANREDNPFEWLSTDVALSLDMKYYLGHSGDKWISPYLRRLYVLSQDGIINDLWDVVSSYLLVVYEDKWNRIYNAYIDSIYKPLENYDMEEVRTPNLTNTENSTKSGSSETKQSTKLETNSTQSSDASTYGFNSTTPVPSASGEGSNDVTVTGDKDDNVTTNTNNDLGSVTSTQTGNEKLTRHGNIGVTTSQQMLQSELDLRQYDFYEKLMLDVDKVLCLEIY